MDTVEWTHYYSTPPVLTPSCLAIFAFSYSMFCLAVFGCPDSIVLDSLCLFVLVVCAVWLSLTVLTECTVWLSLTVLQYFVWLSLAVPIVWSLCPCSSMYCLAVFNCPDRMYSLSLTVFQYVVFSCLWLSLQYLLSDCLWLSWQYLLSDCLWLS